MRVDKKLHQVFNIQKKWFNISDYLKLKHFKNTFVLSIKIISSLLRQILFINFFLRNLFILLTFLLQINYLYLQKWVFFSSVLLKIILNSINKVIDS